MNRPPELSSVPVGGKGQWLHGRLLVIAVAGVGVAVATITIVAALRLASTGADSDWIPVYQDVLKTSFGALAVGGLGGLAKLIFDQRKAREAAQTALRDRVGIMSTFVGLTKNVETARLATRANRTTRQVATMVNDGIIPAHSTLEEMTNSMRVWAGVGTFMFPYPVVENLEKMDGYLSELLTAYDLHDVPSMSWDELQDIPIFRDLIYEGSIYEEFRALRMTALEAMRESVVREQAGRGS
jgi:hypothetical protein